MARDPAAGVTLVEMLVSLALFALIGGAGFAVLDQILRVQRQTESVLAELGDLQRAVHLLAVDASLAEPGSLGFDRATGAVTLARRVHAGLLTLSYGQDGDALVRQLSSPDGTTRTRQTLVGRIDKVEWEWLAQDGSWHPIDRLASPPETVRAAAVTLRFSEGDRSLRRILPLLSAGPP
jgi:general secretion pathway protein J